MQHCHPAPNLAAHLVGGLAPGLVQHLAGQRLALEPPPKTPCYVIYLIWWQHKILSTINYFLLAAFLGQSYKVGERLAFDPKGLKESPVLGDGADDGQTLGGTVAPSAPVDSFLGTLIMTWGRRRSRMPCILHSFPPHE